jgi:hypothetical protein
VGPDPVGSGTFFLPDLEIITYTGSGSDLFDKIICGNFVRLSLHETYFLRTSLKYFKSLAEVPLCRLHITFANYGI